MMPRLAALTAALAAAGLACAVPATAAPAVTDPSVRGYLGFCDTSGRQVRGGLLAAAPFAWTTVSSVAAPTGYEKGKASIVAFQPRKDVDPLDWSGKQLTAASTFTNVAHPMAAATRIDSSFGDFTGTYTPQVQGLFQLRMVFTGVGQPQYSGSYPAVLIKVDGAKWTQVGGGAVNCKAGTARSAELDSLPAERLKVTNARPSPLSATQLKALAVRGSAPGDTSGSAGSSAAGPGAANPTADATVNGSPAANASNTESGNGSSSWPWLVGVAVVLALLAGLIVRRRRSA